MKIVFSIGGSVVAPGKLDRGFVKELADFLAALSKKNQIAVVVGGGAPARKRIREARAKRASEAECDYRGILATRENAKALANELGGKANREIPESIVDAAKLFGTRMLVMGGTEPGHSTDAVAALIAEWANADLLVNATNVDGVYDSDPKENSGARLLDVISIDELLGIVGEQPIGAGGYALLDLTAAKIVQRSRIRTLFLNGRDLNNIKNAIEGRPFRGTAVLL